MGTQTKTEGGDRTPAFENAQVSDFMRAGVLSCSPDTSLQTVARMMATHHVHCIAVTASEQPGDEPGPPWGIVSDLDLAEAAAEPEGLTAGDVCATEVVTVKSSERLERAAQRMVEHQTAHLVVVDPSLQIPIGVISTLDVAGAIARGRA
jgi:CBS domain-containing protein